MNNLMHPKKPAAPPVIEIGELAAVAPPAPEKPTFTLPAEVLPADLPPSGRLVVNYTTVPESLEGELREFIVESVELAEGAEAEAEAEGEDLEAMATADEAFDDFMGSKK